MKPLLIAYNYPLVAASVLTSIVAAYAAFSFAERVAASAGARARLWLCGGACAMGLGIWSMHYLGMQAVVLPVQVLYHVPTVLLSLLLAVGASAGTLAVVSREKMGMLNLGLGGVFMGAAIGGMHYTGMFAMRSSAMEHYSLPVVALSVVVAVVFSWMALWIAFSVRKGASTGLKRLGAAALMGSGIAAMHYTAMYGVTFSEDSMPFSTANAVAMSWLGVLAIGLTTVLVLTGTILAAFYDRRRLVDMQRSHDRLASAQTELIESRQALESANSKLQELAVLDALTGIHNRRYFDDMLQQEFSRAARTGAVLSLLMIDVDHFKKLNDRYGHPVGDRCLTEIAQALNGPMLRVGDVVARYGGEEFAVLLPGASAAGAFAVAERLRAVIEELGIRNEDSPTGRFCTVSIGIDTQSPRPGESPKAMLAAADSALYCAKVDGRNRVHVSGLAIAETVV